MEKRSLSAELLQSGRGDTVTPHGDRKNPPIFREIFIRLELPEIPL
jgi:hypothetical protein